ncbi:MAG TPA: aldose 1-epimerase family protein [Gemmataceae bacterium]|nr:aldose 1-epimerase family protein [Gemmataceae bacterium]
MSPQHLRVLTLATNGTWTDEFQLGPEQITIHGHKNWFIRKQRLRGGLQDGVDEIEVNNGALSFSILPTRGMGIWKGSYHGLTLGWQAPVQGPVHPQFVNLADRKGLGWLTGFNEWLCRCGLVSNGPPGDDQGTALTLHGRIANLPAHLVQASISFDKPHTLTISGIVDEGGLFLGRLRLHTTYSTELDSNRIAIHDEVENVSSQPAEMQLLYHLNFGPPLLQAGSRFALPIREAAPHTPRAAEDIDGFDVYLGPTAGYQEQVYDFLPATDAEGQTLALLRNQNGDAGAVLRWKVQELPCFTIWKNTQTEADGYVTGLEPATNFPYFKAHERSQGRVRMLEPGGRWECTWSIDILDSKAAMDAVLSEIADIQKTTQANINRMPVFGPPGV